MTYDAAIAFAPLTTTERLNDPRWGKGARTLYDPGALKLLTYQSQIPVLCDHDRGRKIGCVRELFRHEDVDGPWLVALATLNEKPAWLEYGTRASFEFHPLQMSSFGDSIVRSGIVSEVSVLSPGVEPCEPLARVLFCKPTEAAKPKPTPPPAVVRASAPPIVHAPRRITPREETEELRRRQDWYGDDVELELFVENMTRELAAVRRR